MLYVHILRLTEVGPDMCMHIIRTGRELEKTSKRFKHIIRRDMVDEGGGRTAVMECPASVVRILYRFDVKPCHG